MSKEAKISVHCHGKFLFVSSTGSGQCGRPKIPSSMKCLVLSYLTSTDSSLGTTVSFNYLITPLVIVHVDIRELFSLLCGLLFFFMLKGNKLCSLKLAKDSTSQTNTGNIMTM